MIIAAAIDGCTFSPCRAVENKPMRRAAKLPVLARARGGEQVIAARQKACR